MHYIGPEGPQNARLAIVAEKPGFYELQEYLRTGIGRPLIGPSGHEVNKVLESLGIRREQVYLTNAVKEFADLGNPTREDIIREQPKLLKELSSLPLLNCIVPMGGAALASLSNFHYDRPLARRGSILESCIGKKMVPTFHPSWYMRAGDFKFRSVMKFDLGRALEQSYFPAIKRPARTYYIEPTIEEVRKWKAHLMGSKYLSFDIETVGRGSRCFISCIAFSRKESEAFCIPLMRKNRSSYWTLEEEREVWQIIQDLLDQPSTQYVTQNGQFDCWHLWRHGICILHMSNGLDTLYMHRTRDPSLPHDLAFLVSVYTEEPYYKDESGRWDAIPVSDEQYWVYNAKDAACTLEVAKNLSKEMDDYGILDLYRSETQALFPIVQQAQQIGIRVNPVRIREIRERIDKEIKEAEGRIQGVIGYIPNTKSPIEMKSFLDKEGVKYNTTTRGFPKLDKEALNVYASRGSQKVRDVLADVLFINSRRTLRSGFTNLALDNLGFYHPLLKIAHTVTGRLASEGSEEGGPQIQNIPIYMRQLFIPDDEESEFTQGDLARAELMIVTWVSGDPLLMRAFREGVDVHRVTACKLFRGWKSTELPPREMLESITVVCPKCAAEGEKKCKHSERDIAKQTGHAFNYRMGARKYTALRRQEGIFVSEATANQYRELLVSQYVKNWHHAVESQLSRTSWQEMPLGRKREWRGIVDSTMIGDALSNYAQSTVGQITNLAMVRMWKAFEANYRPAERPRIITQTHDSILVSHKKTRRAEVSQIMKEAFHRPMIINGEELTIPIELAHGDNWGELS